ncbi:hypothetical protein SK854_05620 [Lentzea sp. BCCO 10_0061]|uniref:DUF1616 domain-containing protein n=1 Tax=Lentzea sokolovensis TaxID=3095429 RepID=A0ABU4UQ15_9PSEU|nr:hypothetical protein [Lentzea sp. BCCO 10_0061]MDX8141582.1 hypothetical protein [Lentzea sp. BCCO 10_0061]
MLSFALLTASLFPVAFLDLDEAGKIAAAVALPLSVFVYVFPSIPSVSARGVPWRRYSIVAAVVIALFGAGGLAYAAWQQLKDIDFTSSIDESDKTWTDGSQLVLPVPGNPPERRHVRLIVSLANAKTTGDCVYTAKVEFVPVVDGKEQPSMQKAPGEVADVPLNGAVRKAEVKLVLRYTMINSKCEVRLKIDKAVLHD